VKRGVLAKVSGALDRAGINIKSVITSQIAINLLLSTGDIKRAYRVIERMDLSAITEMEAIEQLALARENINIRIIVSGASSVATYFIVAASDRDTAIKAIHWEFF